MLSYRHGYHAGNHADVLKHIALITALELMQKKQKPLLYIDTHAGAGDYDLSGAFAEKNKEHLEGFARLDPAANWPPAVQKYLQFQAHYKQLHGQNMYPGSPAIAEACLGQNQRLRLTELHGNEFAALSARFADSKRISLIHGDGLTGLKSALPPIERRAFVLVDPSYEIKTDYNEVANVLIDAHRRFATGVYMLWYPVVDRRQTQRMLAKLANSGIKRQLRVEYSLHQDGNLRGMSGSGVWLINPPWQFDQQMQQALGALQTDLFSKGYFEVKTEVDE